MPAHVLLRGIEGLLPLALAFWFGRSARTDVLLFSWAWFVLAGALLYAAFHDSALIPILIELRRRRPADLPHFLGSVLTHAVLLGVILAAAIAGAAALVFAFRYPAAERALALSLLLPWGTHLVLISVPLFFGAILKARIASRCPPGGPGWAWRSPSASSPRSTGAASAWFRWGLSPARRWRARSAPGQ